MDGNTLSLKYNDGKKTIVVPSEATVVNLVPGSIQPGPRFRSAVGKEGWWKLGSSGDGHGPWRDHPTYL